MSAPQQVLASFGVDAPSNHDIAVSILSKLKEWYTCDSIGATIIGSANGIVLTAENDGGSASSVSAVKNNGISFSPNYGFRGENGTASGVTSSSNHSVVAWYKPASHASIATVALHRQGDSVAAAGIICGINVNTSGHMEARCGNGTSSFVADAGSVTDGIWTFLQAKVNRSALQVSGKINDGSWVNTTITGNNPTNNPAYRIGFDYRTGDGFATNYTNGIIDEVAFFNDVLTDYEFAYLYNSGSGRSYADVVADAA